MANLRSVISALLIDAIKRPDHRSNTTLPHGLRIGFRLDMTTVTMYIGRHRKPPSTVEWDTVMQHLNDRYQPSGPVMVEQTIKGDWQYLYAIWTPARQMELI